MTSIMKTTTKGYERAGMIPTKRCPRHPGVLLKELYMKPRKITVTALAKATGITRKHLSRIVNGHARVSAEIAAKLSAALDTTLDLWMNAQRNVDVFEVREKLKDWKPKNVFSASEKLESAAP